MDFFIAICIGFLVTNSLPHLIPGVHGKRFHSPFASPPVKGKSSAVVNVLWGVFNLALAYALFVWADVNLRNYVEGAGFLLGVLITGLVLAIVFGCKDDKQ